MRCNQAESRAGASEPLFVISSRRAWGYYGSNVSPLEKNPRVRVRMTGKRPTELYPEGMEWETVRPELSCSSTCHPDLSKHRRKFDQCAVADSFE
jgi:hypothetical protein